MSAPMPRSALDQRVFLRFACLLRKLGKRVVLRQNTDHRGSGSCGSDERGGKTADAALHLESFLGQQIREQLRGPLFLQRHLGEVPDLLRYLLPTSSVLIEVGVSGDGVLSPPRIGNHQRDQRTSPHSRSTQRIPSRQS